MQSHMRHPLLLLKRPTCIESLAFKTPFVPFKNIFHSLRALDVSSLDDAFVFMVSLTLPSGQHGTKHTVVFDFVVGEQCGEANVEVTY